MPSKVTRRRFLGGMAAAAGSTILAACASTPQVVKETVVIGGTPQVVEKVVTAAPAPQETIEIRAAHWWGSFMTQSFNAAMKAYPNIKIIDENSDWGEYETKMLTSFAADVAPDIMLVDAYWFGDFWTSGRMLALDELMVDKDNTKWGVDPKVENGFEGKCYGFSVFYPEQMTLWINKDLTDKDGIKIPELGDPEYDTWDWNKFVEVLQEATHRKADGTVEQWGITCIGNDMGGAFTQTVHQNGGRFFDTEDYYHETQMTIDTPEFEEACQNLVDLIFRHKVMMPRDVASSLSPTQTWSGGEFVAFTFEWGNPQNIVEHPFNYTHLPWPFTKQKTLSLGGNCFSINGATKRVQEAFDVLWFITTDDLWNQYITDGWNNAPYDTRSHIDRMGPGVNKNLANKVVHRDPKLKSPDYPGGGDGIFVPRWMGSNAAGQVQRAGKTMVDEMMLGIKPVKQALADMKAAMDPVLAG